MDRRVVVEVRVRSGGRCEVGCLALAEQIHHALPKSRGGRVLDRRAAEALRDGTFDPDRHLAGLVHLCARCHRLAHSNPQYGRSVGIVIPGSVRSGLDGRPVYTGPHARMRGLWGAEGVAA